MKKILIATLVFASLSARAFTPEDFIGAVFGIIADEISKDVNGNNGNPSNNYNKKVILKQTGDKIVLGRTFITDNREYDSLTLPNCINKGLGNKRVARIRLFVNNADVYVDTVRVTFQNGRSQTIYVDDGFSDGDNSKWYDLKGMGNRCIAEIEVEGQIDQPWHHNGPGHWNNGNGGHWNNNFAPAPNFSISIGGSGNNGHNGNNGHHGRPNFDERAIITFVGQME